MELIDYVEEAASALRVPKRHRYIIRSITYDPLDREWDADCLRLETSLLAVEPHEWILKTIGWLQYNYPDGPEFPEASCC
jgi:hypothetical protein